MHCQIVVLFVITKNNIEIMLAWRGIQRPKLSVHSDMPIPADTTLNIGTGVKQRNCGLVICTIPSSLRCKSGIANVHIRVYLGL